MYGGYYVFCSEEFLEVIYVILSLVEIRLCSWSKVFAYWYTLSFGGVYV